MEKKSKIPLVVAFIPARSGSKRIINKNICLLNKHPIIAYTISSALQSNVFSEVIVSTDSEEYANIAKYYGAEVPFLRPAQYAGELSPDIEWVNHMINFLKETGKEYDCFSILRPTNPFRQPETIRRAWNEFISDTSVNSLRAVEKCSQHPGKMWVLRNKRMFPLLPFFNALTPWHSAQYQSLPEVYIQNASLEIAWTCVPIEMGTIAGNAIMPFLTKGYEGFDINDPYDLRLAEDLVQSKSAYLPEIKLPPYQGK